MGQAEALKQAVQSSGGFSVRLAESAAASSQPITRFFKRNPYMTIKMAYVKSLLHLYIFLRQAIL